MPPTSARRPPLSPSLSLSKFTSFSASHRPKDHDPSSWQPLMAAKSSMLLPFPWLPELPPLFTISLSDRRPPPAAPRHLPAGLLLHLRDLPSRRRLRLSHPRRPRLPLISSTSVLFPLQSQVQAAGRPSLPLCLSPLFLLRPNRAAPAMAVPQARPQATVPKPPCLRSCVASPCKPRPDLGRPLTRDPIQPFKRSDGPDH